MSLARRAADPRPAFAPHQRRLARARRRRRCSPRRCSAARSFSAGLVTQLAFWCGQASFFLVLALYLQQGRGPERAGLGARVHDPRGRLRGRLGAGAGADRAPRPAADRGRRAGAGGRPRPAARRGGATSASAARSPTLVPGLLLIGAGMGLLIVPLATTILSGVDARARRRGLGGADDDAERRRRARRRDHRRDLLRRAARRLRARARAQPRAAGCAARAVAALTRLLPARRERSRRERAGRQRHAGGRGGRLGGGTRAGERHGYLTGNRAAYGSRASFGAWQSPPQNRSAPTPVGELLRAWRQRRSLSQLELALEADVSSRHVSFVETGRARPSREMVLHLAEHLEVPLRDRNGLLLAAGYAPVLRRARAPDAGDGSRSARRWTGSCARTSRFPAVVVDRHYNLVAVQRRRRAADRGRRARAARAARQRAADHAAPRGDGAADRQPRAVERAPAAPAAPPGRGHRRPGARAPARRARRLSRRGQPERGPRRRRRTSCCRCGCATPTASCRSSARSRRSARPSTSRSRSWRSRRSTPPTPAPRRGCCATSAPTTCDRALDQPLARTPDMGAPGRLPAARLPAARPVWGKQRRGAARR